MRIITSVIFVSVIMMGAARAQPSKFSQLDSFFHLLRDHEKAMGSFVISKNGSVIYSKVIGHRFISKNQKLPADENTKYRIGSVSKLFTATIIFQLIEEGRLSLNTTVEKYFPDLPNAKVITVSHLLNHRSGIQNYRSIKGKSEPKTHAEILDRIYQAKIEFPP